MEEYIRIDLSEYWLDKPNISALVKKVTTENPLYEFLSFSGNDAVMKRKENPPEYICVKTKDRMKILFGNGIISEVKRLETENPLYHFVQLFGDDNEALMRLCRPVDIVKDTNNFKSKFKVRGFWPEPMEIKGPAIQNQEVEANDFKPKYKMRGFKPDHMTELNIWADNLSKMYPNIMKEYNINPENAEPRSEDDKHSLEKVQEQLERLRNEQRELEKIQEKNIHHALDKRDSSDDAKSTPNLPNKVAADPTFFETAQPNLDNVLKSGTLLQLDECVTMHKYAVSMFDADGELRKKKTVIASSRKEAIDLTRHDMWWYDVDVRNLNDMKYPVKFTASTSWSDVKKPDTVTLPQGEVKTQDKLDANYELAKAIMSAIDNNGYVSYDEAAILMKNESKIGKRLMENEWRNIIMIDAEDI